jgi:glycosyltransferase involved in cell wall biosynthesis
MIKTAIYPKVSIIMPTWNRAAFIMESVESVLSQTYQNWELIIVDDGSEDDTEEII